MYLQVESEVFDPSAGLLRSGSGAAAGYLDDSMLASRLRWRMLSLCYSVSWLTLKLRLWKTLHCGLRVCCTRSNITMRFRLSWSLFAYHLVFCGITLADILIFFWFIKQIMLWLVLKRIWSPYGLMVSGLFFVFFLKRKAFPSLRELLVSVTSGYMTCVSLRGIAHLYAEHQWSRATGEI